MNLFKQYLLTLLFLSSTLFVTQVKAQCGPINDSLALVALYNTTGGANWNNNTNWLMPGLSYENWAGVITNADGCVTNIDLHNNNLVGILPPEIGDLSSLTQLTLYNNQLTGNIPAEIGNLTDLVSLHLEGNGFSGEIPVELGNMSSLQLLVLEYNSLSGHIPSSIGNLTDLLVLLLRFNDLTGPIPPALGNLNNVTFLALSSNRLTGQLPASLANMPLTSFDLSNNQLHGCIPSEYDIFCEANYVNLSNNIGLPNNGDFDIFCANTANECNLTIEGTITFDENQNCTADNTEMGLQGWMVKASAVDGDFYGITDADGHYNIYTNAGDYALELTPSGPYWDENCTSPATVTIGADLAVDTVDFFANAMVECPYLSVDISTPFLRRCFSNTYVVNYCNLGTAIAEDAVITVNFSELINIDSASLLIIDETDNTLTFEIGDIEINECGTFYIYTNVSCEAELGQGLCATAHISPDSICLVSPAWSGATVNLEVECDGTDVRFIISNIGEGDMQVEKSFYVVEDGIIMLQGPIEPLSAGETYEIILPANGSTYMCQAMQVDNHPIPADPTAFVEACGLNDDGNFSIGYLGQFPEYDDASFVSVDCQVVVGSFDPNDKNAAPKGYGEENFIEQNQDIEYHIRFQNTGTDTAFTVMVEDVLSQNLDVASFQRGTSSHPYSVQIVEGNTFKFLFEHILLPDSTTNERESHGFIKFKISQKTDLDLGTTIKNQAAIFFDFNDPVLTNTTLHTIGENFVQITATNEIFITNLNVSLAPNPMVNEATIRISGIDFKSAQLSLFNTLGVLLREEIFNGNEFLLKKGDLPTGVYFFEIAVDGRKGFMGKMVVE